MRQEIPDSLLARLSDFVAARFGLNFPPERWPDLASRALTFLRNSSDGEAPSSLERLLLPQEPAAEMEAFANFLTVGETYFFRDKRGLEILADEIILDLTRPSRIGNRQIRIWSAGCATGEEPYSIAIALHETIPHWTEGRVAIFGTDLNRRALQAASEGIYSEWSFRGVSRGVKSKYFCATADGRWAITPRLKGSVTFGYFNLAGDGKPPWFAVTSVDIIFCRNVLMYLTPAAANHAIDLFHRSLTNGGWLIVSPVEASHVLFSKFEAASFPGAILYRKSNGLAAEFRPSPSAAAPVDLLVPDSPAAPEPVEISYDAALDLYQQGRHQDASEVLHSFVLSYPAHARAALLLARLNADEGRLDEASRWCERAIEIDRVDAEAYYLLAAVSQEQGSFERAVVFLRKALYLNPELVLGHFALGNLAMRLGNHLESAKHFENTLAILARYQEKEVLPQSGGLTAGRLKELLRRQSGI